MKTGISWSRRVKPKRSMSIRQRYYAQHKSPPILRYLKPDPTNKFFFKSKAPIIKANTNTTNDKEDKDEPDIVKINPYSDVKSALANAGTEFPFSDRTKPTVLITGGTKGIGLAIAKLFDKEGYNIATLSRNLSPELPSHFYQIRGSVTSAQTWSAMFPRGSASAGSRRLRPDVLVNAAGIAQSKLLAFMDGDDIDSIISTNLKGTIMATKVVGEVMLRDLKKDVGAKKRGGGGHSPCIINISSLLGLKGEMGTSVYAATKAGMLGFTRSMAVELGGRGVRVNAIVPGYVETEMTKDFSAGWREGIMQRLPLRDKRFGTPDEIAQAALFLARNEYANNCVINLDGGLSAT